MTDWVQRWKNGDIGWHRNTPNTKLIKFIDCLELQVGDTVFVPLCGKSQDIAYFVKQGYQVIGVELSAFAIESFFNEQEIEYSVQKTTEFDIYSADNIRIFCGDYFNLNSGHLSEVKAVYDRASLIALPAELRLKYAQHLYVIIPKDCRILLLTLNYPQTQISGPPFAVNEAEVESLFGKWFECQQLECFNDIENEPKYQRQNVDFIEKSAYCLKYK